MKLTPERLEAFLAALISTGGNISRACEAVDISRWTAYHWKEEDAVFSEAWDKAKAIGLDVLEDEATRRAFEGTEKPVFYLGGQCGTIREYSDTLAIFLLKGGKPEKFRERSETKHDVTGTLAELVAASYTKEEGK